MNHHESLMVKKVQPSRLGQVRLCSALSRLKVFESSLTTTVIAGVGMLLAGSSTANGLPYAFPFQVEEGRGGSRVSCSIGSVWGVPSQLPDGGRLVARVMEAPMGNHRRVHGPPVEGTVWTCQAAVLMVLLTLMVMVPSDRLAISSAMAAAVERPSMRILHVFLTKARR